MYYPALIFTLILIVYLFFCFLWILVVAREEQDYRDEEMSIAGAYNIELEPVKIDIESYIEEAGTKYKKLEYINNIN